VTRAVETTLSADQLLSENKRLKWHVAENQDDINRSDVILRLKNLYYSERAARNETANLVRNDQHSKEIRKLIHEVKRKDPYIVLEDVDLNIYIKCFEIRTFFIDVVPRK